MLSERAIDSGAWSRCRSTRVAPPNPSTAGRRSGRWSSRSPCTRSCRTSSSASSASSSSAAGVAAAHPALRRESAPARPGRPSGRGSLSVALSLVARARQPGHARAPRLQARRRPPRRPGPAAVAALQVWVANVIGFALLYWEIDRGGPVVRTTWRADRAACRPTSASRRTRTTTPSTRSRSGRRRRESTGRRGSSTTSTPRSRTRWRSARRDAMPLLAAARSCSWACRRSAGS